MAVKREIEKISFMKKEKASKVKKKQG